MIQNILIDLMIIQEQSRKMPSKKLSRCMLQLLHVKMRKPLEIYKSCRASARPAWARRLGTQQGRNVSGAISTITSYQRPRSADSTSASKQNTLLISLRRFVNVTLTLRELNQGGYFEICVVWICEVGVVRNLNFVSYYPSLSY